MAPLSRILIVSGLLFFLVPCAFAEKVLVDQETLQQLIERQNVLEQRIRQLEDQLQKAGKGASLPTEPQDMASELEEMSDRLDEVETKSILDKIIFYGNLAIRMDSHHYRNITNIYGEKSDGNTDEIWSTRLRLNLRSDITDSIIFHGRLSYIKLWGNSNFDETILNDFNPAGVPDSEGNLHVERAYADLFIPDTPLSITIGRLPSSDGPPYQYKFFTTRKATWPQLLVDGEVDGIIANVSLEKWLGLPNSMFRVGYAKPIQNYQSYAGVDLEDMRVLIGAFETEIPGISNSLLWLSVGQMWGISPLTSLPDNSSTSIVSYPDSLGQLSLYTLHLQFTDLMKTGLDAFGATTWMQTHPESHGTVFSNGYEIGFLGDNINGDLGDSHWGHAVYVGTRYKLPIAALKYPRLGLEYNYGSQYWVPIAIQGGREIINKLWINGDAWEVYYIQPIFEKHMYCRAGLIYMDYEYYNDNGIYGPPSSSDRSLTTFYVITDIRF